MAHHDLLKRHVASGCVEGVRKAKPNKLRCSAKGCRGSEFVKVRDDTAGGWRNKAEECYLISALEADDVCIM